MFDADGDFIYEHDLENGLWDGHSYDCSFPETPCNCSLAISDDWTWIDEEGDFHDNLLDNEDFEESDADWVDFYTYVDGR